MSLASATPDIRCNACPAARAVPDSTFIAAVIIGGVGKWWGTVIGALLISVIGNGLDILNVSAYFHLVIMGAIIYIAVLVDMKGKVSRS